MSLLLLPNETLLNVFLKLIEMGGIRDVFRVQRVCKLWRSLSPAAIVDAFKEGKLRDGWKSSVTLQDHYKENYSFIGCFNIDIKLKSYDEERKMVQFELEDIIIIKNEAMKRHLNTFMNVDLNIFDHIFNTGCKEIEIILIKKDKLRYKKCYKNESGKQVKVENTLTYSQAPVNALIKVLLTN
ncbi:uncharacterized protein OCT59_027598 [Rhizophagus irregularis]|uniref:F-box domain-containing protein n=4 Tax=Rhizophagus irregularis TaxID=588596 RepID=A0A2P4PRL4_RHIID|nr:hypothetical protein GLOIN_2v1481117 [Rhizophagus irregularis DAOM 181602=DAOM 197198]UZO07312.1 hypothetical protein OCT59_027598 [Rhizophagus irregularis]POG68028.1 hypothetical protein GLOIN_2v1481117 [Rhizophagus irregularis DAOM 181602=DAOM 197198]CAB4387380.1 unnamed protein product [Rhizophagus irregularis]CAB4479195.1 unnamed protein product [Rhizophagus irregularis]CAB5160861.1 unnamed protein product [Rhizophagus irregularis]|eukprot:XP_025174894.1 hypothetical protein GLOIN_2v1481117 [Rhizophagus irregularis DAOM 181602=DAOM 197198]